MARLSNEFIDEVIQKTDIVDLVSEKVTLSKQGKSYFGLCPFHNEKTPSFSVEPERKIFNCFSCGEKGNAITFKQKIENITFIEAVEDLAIRANMNVDFTSYKKENPFKVLHEINENAKNFYKLYLSSTKQGQIAKEYLSKRGIKDDIIQAFELGLSSKDFDLLFKTLSSKDVLQTDMYDLGLIKQGKNDNFYDLFRDRIIFPIHDEKGNVVAFSGRTYLEDDTSAKYINSPQTKVFTKSNVLYNFHHALSEIKKTNRIVLFEGPMDVIAAYKSNVKDGVASMGTSLTKDQVKLIKKYTNNVTICYDGDAAGIVATQRAISLFEKENMNIKIVILPEGLDPDDYINKFGTETLNKFINDEWIDKIEFNYQKNNMDIDFTKLLDVEHFKKTIFDLVKNSSNTIIESYIKRLAKDTNISVESIRQDFNQYTRRNISNISEQYRPPVQIASKFEFAERRLLNYFLLDNKYLQRYRQEFGPVFCINNEVRHLKEMIEEIYYDKTLNEEETVDINNEFLELLNDTQKSFFINKCTNDKIELIKQEYEDMIDVMNDYQQIIQSNKLEEKIREATSIEEKIKLATYRDIKIKEDKHGQR